MKRMKQLLTTTAAVIFASLALSGATGHGASPNTPSAWAQSDVQFMVEEGLVPKSLQGQYRNKITRAEFTAIAELVLYRVTNAEEKLHKVLTEQRFQDSFEPYVYKAYQFGIVNGINESEFMPNRPIERKEAAVMMSNMLKTVRTANLSNEKAPYVDYAAIPSWAREAANITYHANIFKGSAAGMEPDKPYTREQSIVTMKRLLDAVHNVEGISYRGKIFVKFDQIDDVRVGWNYVKLGSPKAQGSLQRLWQSVSHQFSGVTPNGYTKETLNSEEFTIETLGDDYLIKISW
ncbi:S-layer homology domain-containing protein [Paenibacillus sp. GCM10027627]|uniref:S-layer homology domain-containing protein n=1 Tax=unclassified Paenibacillus TaxID=185978 RepID=UPI00362A2B07